MINKIILMGRLTADPKFSQTQSGVAYCRFSVAVDRKFADKNTGERQADFINCVAWRQTAEFISKYFSKGKMIIVEGNLRNNNYTDANGVKHYSYDVFVDDATFGETKSASMANGSYAAPNTTPANNSNNTQQNNNKPVQNVPANNNISAGNISDFQEIISENDLPF